MAKTPELQKVMDNLKWPDHVYFMQYWCQNDNTRHIYIGSTVGARKDQRIKEHLRAGATFLAAVRGCERDEVSIQTHFKDKLSDTQFPGTTSLFAYEAIYPYVDRLIKRFIASTNIAHIPLLSKVDYKYWNPVSLPKPKGFFGYTPPQKTADRNSWQTPVHIIQAVPEAFNGQIDLDPASCFESYDRMEQAGCAPRYFYTEEINGLSWPWEGKVFLNPPYSEDESESNSEEFTRKFITEFKRGKISDAILLLNTQSHSAVWFDNLIQELHPAWALSRKFLRFHGKPSKNGNADAFGPARNGTVFLYFGNNRQRFWKAFTHLAYPLQKPEGF